ncbi:MAG: NAD-dependent epimerase/dehydratase family protein [Chitinophagaceae bacterium]|nr:MAG: NAD-dependent epimerase/dehydratase family protein [Chitinophagaceae bacterium]
MKHYVITGGAGFIGSNLIRNLLQQGEELTITCIDKLDDFYSVAIKEQHIQEFKKSKQFRFLRIDIDTATVSALEELILEPVDVIIHLAAKTGVRPSLSNPLAYQQTNIRGTQLMLDFSRAKKCHQFIFASSSSVYGENKNFPWKETEPLLPISPYAMTKLSGEMLGHIYHHIYGLRFIALRFFTVYGPGQRPDLAIHKFVKNILEEKSISFFGKGASSRDYTYIDDIVQGIKAAIAYTNSGFEIINLGNNKSIVLHKLVAEIEEVLKKNATIHYLPEQPGEVHSTFADITKAKDLLGYQPKMKLKDGLQLFYDWYVTNRDLLNS